MLRAIAILCFATAAMATSIDLGRNTPQEKVIRIGSVGATFANLRGVLVPTTSTFSEGYPAYEFKTIMNGAPIAEAEHLSFRCSPLNDFYIPNEDSPKPVLFCRNNAIKKGAAEKIAFLFSAEDLAISPGVNDIELALGKNLWKTFISSHAAAFAFPPRGRAIGIKHFLKHHELE